MAAESTVGIPKTRIPFHNEKIWNCIIFLSFSSSILIGTILSILIYKEITLDSLMAHLVLGAMIGCAIEIPLFFFLHSIIKK